MEAAVPDWAGLDYTTFREMILGERVRELAGEQGTMRWYDLVRRGILVESIRFLNDYDNPLTGGPEPWWAASNGPGLTIDAHHVLMPIPQNEIDANPLLTQTQGY